MIILSISIYGYNIIDNPVDLYKWFPPSKDELILLPYAEMSSRDHRRPCRVFCVFVCSIVLTLYRDLWKLIGTDLDWSALA